MALTFLLLGTGEARAQQTPVVIVPVVTDPTDTPRLVGLAKVLRTAMADRGVPAVAAQYTATLETAKASGDTFAAALDLSGEFATLRYGSFSDERVRAHTLRLLELAKARTAMVLAAPLANRLLLRRISRADGQSVALPDPSEPELVQRALAELLPRDDSADPAPTSTERLILSCPARKWLLGAAGATGLGTATLTVALATKRRNLGAQFQDAAPSDSDYLTRGDAWRARRAPMLASAAVAAASLSVAGVLFASDRDRRPLRWTSISAAGLGSAALAWGGYDMARGSPCPPEAASGCVHAQGQLDRGLLLALAAAPFLAVASTALVRWIPKQIHMAAHTAPRAVSVSLVYPH